MNIFIAAVMIIGRKREPFLSANLESISRAVDLLVLNDNSEDAVNPNLKMLEESTLFKEGKVRVIPSRFEGFGYCRTLCLDYLIKKVKPSPWILYLDADEVHPPGLTVVTRKILPSLPGSVGIVDGFKYEFFRSRKYYLFMDRRHNLFFRLNPDVRWEGKVHEKPVNLIGRRVAIPYRYFHYGYLINPRDIIRKWELYANLAEQTDLSGNEDYESLFRKDARRVLQYRGLHPAVAMSCIEELESENRDSIEQFEDMVRQHKSVNWLGRKLRNTNADAKIRFQAINCMNRFFFKPSFVKSLKELMRLDAGQFSR